MKFRHSTLLIFSGILWLLVGFFLLRTGLHLFLDIQNPTRQLVPLYQMLTLVSSSPEHILIVLTALGLIIGHCKGRFILSKSANRIMARVTSQEEPLSLLKAYSPYYFLLIFAMMMLGMAMKVIEMPIDIRGLIDVAVGSALLHGSIHFFRSAFHLTRQAPRHL